MDSRHKTLTYLTTKDYCDPIIAANRGWICSSSARHNGLSNRETPCHRIDEDNLLLGSERKYALAADPNCEMTTMETQAVLRQRMAEEE
jgi:hypothetical protein